MILIAPVCNVAPVWFSPLDVAGKERAEVRKAPVDVMDVGKALVLHFTVSIIL